MIDKSFRRKETYFPNEDRPSIYFIWGRREKHAVFDLNLPGYFWFLINILLFQALAIEYIKTISWVQIESRVNPVRSGNVSQNEKNGVTLTHCKLSLNISLSSPRIGQMTRNVTLENSSHTCMRHTHHGELRALTSASIVKTWHNYCPTFPVN